MSETEHKLYRTAASLWGFLKSPHADQKRSLSRILTSPLSHVQNICPVIKYISMGQIILKGERTLPPRHARCTSAVLEK